MQTTRKNRPPRVADALAITLAVLAAWVQTARAAPNDNSQVSDTLAQQVEKSKVDAAPPPPPPAKPAKSSPVTAGKDPKLTMKIGGRFRVNAVYIDDDKNHNTSGTQIRRARLDISGKVYDDWSYMLSLDFARSTDVLRNAYFTYSGIADTDIILGYFKPMFSLEYQSTNKGMEFGERALTDESFNSEKRVGAAVSRHVDSGTREYTAAVGIFGQEVPADTKDNGDSGYSIFGRATYAFLHTNNRLLHLGGSVEWRRPGNGEVTRMRTRPSVQLANRMVDTGEIADVHNYYKLAGEAAIIVSRLAMEAEYVQATIKRDHGLRDLGFNGWYVQGSFFLTKNSRATAYEQGEFGIIEPNDKIGDWQVAVRYDEIDLTDRDIVGGREADLAIALNWYVNRYMRYSLNYNRVMRLDHPGSPYHNDKPSMALASLWLAW